MEYIHGLYVCAWGDVCGFATAYERAADDRTMRRMLFPCAGDMRI